MAFEGDLGIDASQAHDETYAVSATGLVSRTFNQWFHKLGQYIIIVGLVGTILALVSFFVLVAFFSLIGTMAMNPIAYIFNNLLLPPLPGTTLIVVSLVFATLAFIINAVITGAATKFALDDYGGGRNAEVGASFSFALGKTGTIIIVQIIQTILVTGAMAPGLALSLLALSGIDITDPFNPIIAPGTMELMMGSLVLLLIGVVVAVYFSIRFAPVMPVVVDSNLSAIDSLKKSWSMTGGNMLHVFGGLFLVGIIVAILDLMASMVLFFTPYYATVSAVISALLFSAISYVFSVVLYRDLSARRGESSLDSLMVG
ncbi:MAG: hypothetical protein EAX87_08590 [Candidatus Thorarchaeota archaeon]|nr:hypothetical protein [Candidatus Thorarchaeota archaeon]